MIKPFNLLVLFLFVLSATQPVVVQAAPAGEQAVFTFTELGLESDIILRGPYDTNSIRFDLPPSWFLLDGSELVIEVSASFAGANEAGLGNNLGALLEVYFNDKIQQVITLTEGEKYVYRIRISPGDLVSPYEGGWYKISFFLDAAIDCEIDERQTAVIISSKSSALFPYAVMPLRLDLRRLPWPIYQERVKTAEPSLVVLPASPSADELRAGMITMGAFGRSTGGRLPLSLSAVDQLTGDLLQTSNLIFVGKPLAFSTLRDAELPVPLTGSAFSSPELKEGDGLLQMFISPWNKNKVALWVSGNTDLGVVKAAQALSTGNLQTSVLPSYAVIAQVNPNLSSGVLTKDAVEIPGPDFALADLGYTFQTATGIGENYLTYQFTIPQGQVPAETPYLELKYSNSVLVDEERSEALVYLNDILIGGVQLSVDSGNLTTEKIDLPINAFRPWVNKIDVVFVLIPTDNCSVFSFSSIWATVHSDSAMHLTLVEAPTSDFALGDINHFPQPFAGDPTFSSTAFVLPQNNPVSWTLAGNVAYELGAGVSGPILAFETFFDSQIPGTSQGQNLIVIGEPKELSIVSDLKDTLPAYFEAGSNVAILETQQVIYRIAEKKSLGYLELFKSPWGKERAVLGIFGTTGEGLMDAGRSLLDPRARESMAGNFVTLDGSKALVMDTETGLGIGRIQPGLGEDVVTQEENALPAYDSQAEQERLKRTTFFGILVVVALIVVVVVIALWLRKKNA